MATTLSYLVMQTDNMFIELKMLYPVTCAQVIIGDIKFTHQTLLLNGSWLHKQPHEHTLFKSIIFIQPSVTQNKETVTAFGIVYLLSQELYIFL